jgi:hypothetical protein
MRHAISVIIIVVDILFVTSTYSKQSITAIVTADSVRLRENSDVKSKIISLLKKGDKVTVLGHTFDMPTINDSKSYWFEVSIDNKSGWIFGQFLGNFSDYEYTKYYGDEEYYYKLTNLGGYEKSEMYINYSFEYPEIWKKEGMVFYDYQNNKIAELTPGGVVLNNYSFNLLIKPEDDDSNITIVSTEQINISKFKCTRIVEKGSYTGEFPDRNGVRYKNTYILEHNNKFFKISFFDESPNPGKRSVFEHIVSTIDYE